MGESKATSGNAALAKAQNKAGLEGIVAATTSISNVDGEAGRLIYRGYDIHDLAHSTTFEEIAHLLWFGHLPTRTELDELRARLVEQRRLPEAVISMLRALPAGTAPMDALRTAVSTWGMYKVKGAPSVEQAIGLTASF